ncbi:ParB/RepB/Spo0J family partition protein [Phyllobacterium leguminum]|uniref:ParB family chromosome partitioning protein n=1 Tax=Phyllobacterium leguminum TaxID=314237 RepID=A0A318T2K5_9HYPH|nr:ParB N-terminal domain-containing protein [Phyllobacterium leguminum]PYE86880.1 ParB family chromosome partitioning protein [Phyllobacterium leguminum]
MSIELKTLPIDKIFIDPERIRPVDEGHAFAIRAEIMTIGFTDPILVRHTPRRSEQPYTLIDGAHRLRAAQLQEEDEVLVFVVEADKDTATMMEAGANLFRHMTVLDQALAIYAYRAAWERKYGKITRGGDQSAKLAVCSIDEISGEKSNFSKHCVERLGMSKRSVERSVLIAKNLTRPLIECIRGSAYADHQSILLKLASLDAQQQETIVASIKSGEKTLDDAIRMGVRMVGSASDALLLDEDEERKREFDIAISGFGRLNRQERISAVIYYWGADERAIRSGLKKLGFDIVPLGASK